MKNNLFKKFYNYRLQQELMSDTVFMPVDNDKYNTGKPCKVTTGPFVFTEEEKAWVKKIVNDPEANAFLQQTTIEKINNGIKTVPVQKKRGLCIKGAQIVPKSDSPHFAALCRIMRARQGIRIDYRQNDGIERNGEYGYPYKLELSMSRQEWYIIWLPDKRMDIYYTPLRNIIAVEAWEGGAKNSQEHDEFTRNIQTRLRQTMRTVSLLITKQHYYEIHRVVYALSCFEREMTFDEQSKQNILTIRYLPSEEEYLLSKIRFLSKIVTITSPERLIKRMHYTATKTLSRYTKGEE